MKSIASQVNALALQLQRWSPPLLPQVELVFLPHIAATCCLDGSSGRDVVASIESMDYAMLPFNSPFCVAKMIRISIISVRLDSSGLGL